MLTDDHHAPGAGAWPGAPAVDPDPPRPPVASAADGGRGTSRIGALIEVILCSGFPTQIALIALLSLAGLQPFENHGGLSLQYVGLLSMLDAVLLTTLVVAFLRIGGESPSAVFLGWRSVRREALLGLLLTPVAFLLAATVLGLVLRYAPRLHNVAENPLEGLIQDPLDAALFVIVAVVAGGVREELQRAFIIRRFEQHLGGAVLGIALYSVAFGAGHVIQGYDAALATGLLGAFWGVVYLMRRSVLAPIVSHSLFNVAEIVHHSVFA